MGRTRSCNNYQQFSIASFSPEIPTHLAPSLCEGFCPYIEFLISQHSTSAYYQNFRVFIHMSDQHTLYTATLINTQTGGSQSKSWQPPNRNLKTRNRPGRFRISLVPNYSRYWTRQIHAHLIHPLLHRWSLISNCTSLAPLTISMRRLELRTHVLERWELQLSFHLHCKEDISRNRRQMAS